MSRFFSKKYSGLVPYTPGEQPKERKYIKLNTNESPFPPSELAQKMAAEAAKRLMLYPDPDCRELTATLSELIGVSNDEIVWTNGSDDVLNFAFMAFCDSDDLWMPEKLEKQIEYMNLKKIADEAALSRSRYQNLLYAGVEDYCGKWLFANACL